MDQAFSHLRGVANTLFLSIIFLTAGQAAAQEAAAHQAAAPAKHAKHGKRPELGMSLVAGPDGSLWTLSRQAGQGGDFAVLRHSGDGGITWSSPQAINAEPEPIWANGEAKPNLALGPRGQIYASWTRPAAANFAGDIRFTYSRNGGKNWAQPVTVQQDRQPITHRFDTLYADGQGRVYLAWTDKRDAESARKNNQPYDGAAVYYAVSEDGGATWKGDFKLADQSCECCRISLAPGSKPDDAPLAFWREVFPGSERDHAISRLDPAGKPQTLQRATFDRWKVASCPHHGPALAVTKVGDTAVRHGVWYTQEEGEGRVFYGRLAASGSQQAPENRIRLPEQAEHADIAADGNKVWIAWKSFDGERTGVGMIHSTDGGKTWSQPQTLARTAGASDYPRLAAGAKKAWLAWNTERDGVIIRALP